MTIDRRDQILDRLAAIAVAVPGVVTAGRNLIRQSDTALPSVSILEGDEEIVPNFTDKPTYRPEAPMTVQMSPHAIILVKNDAADIGTQLNALRGALIKAVLTDDALKGLVRNRTGIRYHGLASALALGRQLSADMGLVFRFDYVLRVDEL